jgi:hypothetical protein
MTKRTIKIALFMCVPFLLVALFSVAFSAQVTGRKNGYKITYSFKD